MPVDIGLAGDADYTLGWLIDQVPYQTDRSHLETHQKMMKDWWDHLAKHEEADEVPIKPQRVLKALQQVADDDAILSVDVGNVTVWVARHFRMIRQQFLTSAWLATLGCGLPGAIASKIAHPDKQVFAICGDGGFGMTMNDFVTAVKYGLPIVVVVLNNHKIAMIKFEQEVMGNVEFGTDLTNPNFARYAEICGGIGYRWKPPINCSRPLSKRSGRKSLASSTWWSMPTKRPCRPRSPLPKLPATPSTWSKNCSLREKPMFLLWFKSRH